VDGSVMIRADQQHILQFIVATSGKPLDMVTVT